MFTLEAYLELEARSEQKFEFCDWAILAMTGGSLRHNEIAVNILVALRSRFPGACRTLGSDQRIATGDGVYTYPDASVVCGEPQLSRHQGTETLHNPVLLVEVLSPSTLDYDLGEKLEHYQTIPTLAEVLLVDADGVDVRHVSRSATGWEIRRVTSLEAALDLRGVAAALPLVEVYGRARIA